jgi:hypothetical protein
MGCGTQVDDTSAMDCQEVWLRTYGDVDDHKPHPKGGEFISMMSPYPNGDIAVAGYFDQSIRFGDVVLEDPEKDLRAAFVARIDPCGRPRFARRWGPGVWDSAKIPSLGVDDAEEMVFLSAGGGGKKEVVKLAPDGSVRWQFPSRRSLVAN